MVGWLFDNIRYKSNPLNDDFDDLTFDGDKSLITRWQLYRIHDNIVFGLKNRLSIDIEMNRF